MTVRLNDMRLHRQYCRPGRANVGSVAGMSGTGAEVDVGTMTVSELLGTYARILAELRRRDVVRTYNAPVGD